MTAKQKAKHITDSAAKILTPTSGSSLDAAEPTPDGLGAWEGGIAALVVARRSERRSPMRAARRTLRTLPALTMRSKSRIGKILDFNEIHIEPTAKFWLYNRKTDAWDIEGDSSMTFHTTDDWDSDYWHTT